MTGTNCRAVPHRSQNETKTKPDRSISNVRPQKEQTKLWRVFGVKNLLHMDVVPKSISAHTMCNVNDTREQNYLSTILCMLRWRLRTTMASNHAAATASSMMANTGGHTVCLSIPQRYHSHWRSTIATDDCFC